jgi:bacteriocin-like protein
MTNANNKFRATSKQLREPTCELTEDELEHVSGGKPSAAPKDQPVHYLTYKLETASISSY